MASWHDSWRHAEFSIGRHAEFSIGRHAEFSSGRHGDFSNAFPGESSSGRHGDFSSGSHAEFSRKADLFGRRFRRHSLAVQGGSPQVIFPLALAQGAHGLPGRWSVMFFFRAKARSGNFPLRNRFAGPAIRRLARMVIWRPVIWRMVIWRMGLASQGGGNLRVFLGQQPNGLGLRAAVAETGAGGCEGGRAAGRGCLQWRSVRG